ncbi:MAG TPA: hypothetical protein VGD10_10175 [Allosphingosinicella sp.]|uniref:hypothetical protein n=1 Tax=Allosphingosinicella sp. TaxID=2823234 RepID=UPI002ED85DAE
MDKTFWLKRQQESADMARNATSAAARLVHLELAGRYSIEAAAADDRPALHLEPPTSMEKPSDREERQ